MENFFEIWSSQIAKNALKLTTMVGEIFEICSSQPQMAKNAFKLSTIIYLSRIAKNALELSTMVGEIIEIYLSQIAENALNCPS